MRAASTHAVGRLRRRGRRERRHSSSGAASVDERSELKRMIDPDVEEVTGETYGPLKVMCEDEVLQAFPCASPCGCGRIRGWR
jgi:hypothetical protein